MGADKLLVKPVHTRILLEQIESLLASHEAKLAKLGKPVVSVTAAKAPTRPAAQKKSPAKKAAPRKPATKKPRSKQAIAKKAPKPPAAKKAAAKSLLKKKKK